MLPDDLSAAMDAAWSEVKSFDEAGNSWLIPVLLVVAVVLVVVIVWRKSVKKKRNDY